MAKYVATTGERFDSIQIRLASPEEILKWSRGEVKKPETINYRTFKPEKDGLFCERIFGPVKDWECGCGKYKKVKHRGITCDRCGVEITESKVRRERMGCIKLAVPVTHIWFFKTTPSCIGNLLDLSIRTLERIIYFENYIVIDPGDTDLDKMRTLTEDEYQEERVKYGDRFVAKMGAEAIKMLLEEIDIETLSAELHATFASTGSAQARAKAIKRLKVIEALRKSGNNPAWMVLDVVPVIPPDLRPLVPLEGGRYATSDLNDLYRRVINRNNRLKRLIELRAPEVILRNEKRMLQEAVDALFDNGRHGRTVLGAGNRPLKSLSDMLKGKQGRFRQNLLGKRVDYSGRSVIVVGPELKLHQCGLPKRMVLELFEPFIIHELKERGVATTIKAAKRAIAQGRSEVWDILEDVIKDHPVLLNRAPTLHRLGIQAFQPVLVEGKAIRIHPLVCRAFNADFDGDQMAVHVPLMAAAQLEAHLLMMSSSNIFSPSDGSPIVTPSQDIVLGISWMTRERPGAKGEWKSEWVGKNGEFRKPGKVFPNTASVVMAYASGKVDIHARVKVHTDGKIIDTTVGRVLLAEELPDEISLQEVNREHDQSSIGEVIARCYLRHGHAKTVELLDALKRVGFKYATMSGLSVAIVDMVIPPEKKELIDKAQQTVERIDEMYQNGLITEGERYNKIIDEWTTTTEAVSAAMLKHMEDNAQGFSGIYLMYRSKARGSKSQIRQLAAMRGLMAKPSGDIIESPITSNFREGLTVVEYFISSHGARKGLADTALKTADAGYLTRRLVDVAQDVVIEEDDCGTLNGIWVEPLMDGSDIIAPLEERVVGRYALEDITIPGREEPIVEANEEIDDAKAREIVSSGLPGVRIRSVLTCQSKRGVCAKCYGRNLATGKLVELGEAVGIIAAQSIGEPGTQLTMRTFHIGGAASRQVESTEIQMADTGKVEFRNVRTAVSREGKTVVVNRGGEIAILSKEGKELHRYAVPTGCELYTEDGDSKKKGQVIYKWDPYNISIMAEQSGTVRLEGMVEGVTMRVDINPDTGLEERVISDHKHDLHPQITIEGKDGEIMAFATIPAKTHVLVKDGDRVKAGDLLAKTPRQFSKTKDITGGLPRVAELFEARQPKDPAVISHIDGIVELAGASKGMRKVKVIPPVGKERIYTVPPGKHLNVATGDRLYAGQRLTDGPIIPTDILEVQGEDALRRYLLDEVQQVYRLQGVRTNDKHIEVIIRQMLRKVRIKDDPGDTSFLAHEEVDKIRFQEVNESTRRRDGRPAEAEPVLQGITKAALSTESFVAAASFQQTTRVLTDAALSGKRDYLRGLKENVIIGHLIPAGTGSPHYQKSQPQLLTPELADFTAELEIETAPRSDEAEIEEESA
ncbi:MAG: DNA-directed RNA polymerase subunit beta' [Candidatus Hydrogenedentes bacterium]|nr:DNA-directed RNA polymerase subunit beta' [Candidatus Hydrogenedentota bacterium]MBI3118073.1 DNA-directed RNA polymerase subunit beta' [Candidatus Hydrogenedentota bacterium]